MEDLYEHERYSVCIAHADDAGLRTYYKYFRVADYDPEADPDELIPPLLQKDVTSLEESQANPDHLYNPAAAYHHEDRQSDFFIFKWRLDPDNPGRQLTRGIYDTNDGGVSDITEPREVIIPKGVSGEADLRVALSEGIPFEGKTTSVFYLVYKMVDGECLAAVCDRKNFSFEGGTIKLRSSVANVRATTLSVPYVMLESYEILESPHVETSYRRFYGRLAQPPVQGSILLRPLSYYASDYVKWYVKEESLALSRGDRQSLAQMIDTALMKPDALEAYLGASAQESEVEALRLSIASIASTEDEPSKKLMRDALLRDESFRQMCVKQVAESDDATIAEKRMELAEVETALESANKRLASVETRLDELRWNSAEADREIAAKKEEIEKLENDKEGILDELQSNAALRLGLQVTARAQRLQTSGITFEKGAVSATEPMEESLEAVTAENMMKLGLTCIGGRANDERLRAATSIVAAMSATNLLAMTGVIARVAADALCIALAGHRATRIFVPTDYRDVDEIISIIKSDGSPVVVVDNVIDPVNEGILLSLIGCESLDATIVLPFASYASARLISHENWESVFIPSVESLVLCPGGRKAAKFAQCTDGMKRIPIRADDVVETTKDLVEELDGLGLPQSGFVLPAAVLNCAANLVDDMEDSEPLVSQHLAMAAGVDNDGYSIIEDWSSSDEGLDRIAVRLGIEH